MSRWDEKEEKKGMEEKYGFCYNAIIKTEQKREEPLMQSSCEYCRNYVYDDEYDSYFCQVNLDEDEMERFLAYKETECPYFQYGDDYSIVKHQM